MQVTYGLLEPFHHGRGYQEAVFPKQPAAGANYSKKVDGKWWTRLLTCTFTLTTSATVADRLVTIDYTDPTGALYLSDGAPVALPASQTGVYFGSRGRTVSEWNTGTPTWFPLTAQFIPPGYTVGITVAAIDTTDQISGIGFLYERFETNESGYITGGVDLETFQEWAATVAP